MSAPVVPTLPELTAFLCEGIAEAHRLGDTARTNDLLEKLSDVEGMHAFLGQVLP